MSQENVEAAKAIWFSDPVELVALFRALDAPSPLLAAISPDTEVVFVPLAPGAETPTFQGLEGLAEGWRDWLEPYDTYWLEVEDFIDGGGDEVLMPARVQARTRRDGVLIDHAPAAICTLTDGKISRLVFYLDRGKALEAVGLSE